jgi:hypothetical protein
LLWSVARNETRKTACCFNFYNLSPQFRPQERLWCAAITQITGGIDGQLARVAANGAAPPRADASPSTVLLAEHAVGLFADGPRYAGSPT